MKKDLNQVNIQQNDVIASDSGDDNNIITTTNFIRNIVINDLENGKHKSIITRFPPEPNGYLHIGHVKSICLNFGLAEEFKGKCNLRFDDTNPEKETIEYIESIKESVKWLGFFWDGEVKYASDYFLKFYHCAEFFIKNSLAYVCDLSFDEIRNLRGDLTTPGKDSPYRNRSVAENLKIFAGMKAGEFEEGSRTLRLKIDMNSPNLNLRDPVIYRIKKLHHIRTGDEWCIYPTYDYAHCISDALENITHSCCTLEFEDHRPLYDWIVKHLFVAGLLTSQPRQIEFSRLELQHTVTSKRKLLKLVTNELVDGWDDPRMPTISGMRRRGYTADGLKLFIKRCGVSKSPNIVDMPLLEGAIREDLENKVPRVMAVLKPIKILLTNFNIDDETKPITQSRTADFHPKRPELGDRSVVLTKEIFIERDDFIKVAPNNKWHRLCLHGEVRLRHSYIIYCNDVIVDANGEIIELHCSIDHDTLGKNPTDRKVKGVIHWVSATESIKAKVRIYDTLFTVANPDKVVDREFTEFINNDSLNVVNAYVEPFIANAVPEQHFQFERLGYFVTDRILHQANGHYVFNKIVDLKDSYKK